MQLLKENLEKLAGLIFTKFLDLIEVIFMAVYTVFALVLILLKGNLYCKAVILHFEILLATPLIKVSTEYDYNEKQS